jgi:hypothetical protein
MLTRELCATFNDDQQRSVARAYELLLYTPQGADDERNVQYEFDPMAEFCWQLYHLRGNACTRVDFNVYSDDRTNRRRLSNKHDDLCALSLHNFVSNKNLKQTREEDKHDRPVRTIACITNLGRR